MATFNTVITNVSGSVGIGTTSVTSRLLVLGNSSNLGEQIATFKPNGSQTGGVGVLDVQNSGGSSILFVTGSGNVGIGSSSPAVKLDVAGAIRGTTFASDRFGLNVNPINTASTSQSFIRFQSTGGDFYVGTESSTGGAFFPGSTAYSAVLYNGSSTPIHFYTGASLKATITSAGRVGIGLTDPSALLANTNTTDGMAAANSSGIQWKSTANDWAAVIISRPASGNNYGLRVHGGDGTTSSDYPFWVSSGTTTGTARLVVRGDGNVGVGQTNPGNLFTVNQASNTAGGTFTSYGFMLNNQGTARLSIGNDGTYSLIQSWNNNPLIINNQGNNIILAGANANVGIHTTTVSARLHVQGSTNTLLPTLLIKENQAMADATATLDVQNSSGTSLFFVSGSGNIGVGTAGPTERVTIQSAATGTAPQIRLQNPVVASVSQFAANGLSGGQYLFGALGSFPQAARLEWLYDSTDASFGRTGSLTFSVINATAGGLVERMRLSSAGNVGIGTTSPEGDFDVRINGIGGTVQSAWSSAGMPYSTYGNLTITQRHSTAVGSGAADGFGYAGPFIDLRAANGAAEWSVSQIMGVGDPFGTGTYNGGLAFLVSGGGSNDPTGRRNAGDAPQVRMLIGAAKTYISTDVGIGTTNPSSKLHVAGGDIRFNSTYGIIGATNTAGNVLRADGTRFVPAQLSYSDLSTTNMPVRTVSYTSITGASGDWYPLFKFGATDTTGAVVCTLSTASHSSVTFAVNRGWPGSNFYSISVLNCVLNPNGGFPVVTEIRVIADSAGTYDAQVEVKLVWTSGPTTNVTASVMSSPMNVVFAASLATTAAGSASPGVSDSVVLSNNMMRAKGNIITPAGVGIGTTNPSVKLHVNGSGTEQFRIMGDGAGFLFSGYDQTNSRGRIGAYTGAAYTSLILNEGGGNVGIGLTNPDTNVSILRSSGGQFPSSGTTPTNAALRIKASANNAVYVGIDVGSPYGAWIQAADVTGFGATYPVLLNPNGGSVGIGTYNPSGVLEVRQTNNAGRTNVTFINPATASTSNRMRLRIAASGGFNGTDLHPYMEAYEENAGNAANGLAFGTYNGSALGERLRIDASGNVGIGKTNPAYPLDVTGTSRYTGIAYYDGGESINLYGIRGRFSGEAMHLYNKVAIGYPSGWGGDISTTPIYGLSTYGGAILAYNQGTVGIGTATSSVRLYVHGSSTATTPTMLVKEGVASPTNGVLAFEVEKSTGATIFAVSGSGFVGVGTSNPAGTFEVVGVSGSLLLVTDNLSGSLFSVNDVTGLPILEVFSDDTLIAGRVNTNALVVTGSSVGIGTSNTNGNRLAVNGQASITGSALPGADNTYDLGSSSPQYRWRTLHAVNISGSLTPTGATAGSVFFAGVSGQIAQDNANFFWDDANNRLGIGTATPGAALDVVGAMQVTTTIVPIAAVATNGSLRFREFGSSAANNTIELHVRPSAGKSGYLTFTEDSVADRWSVGIANGNGNLRFISGTPTGGSLRASLEAAGNWMPAADDSQNLGSASLRWKTLFATNISGSLTPTGATAGSVFFAGVSGQIAQDNANLFWDDTNDRLGIGTNNADGYRLRIFTSGGAIGLDNQATLAAKNSGGSFETFLWPRWSDNVMYLNYGSAGFNIRNSSSTSTMFMTNGGNVGLGPTSPSSKLTVGTDFASVAGITVDTGGAGDSALITRRAASKPAFSILPWDTEVYLTAGVYYDGTTWVHHSNSTNSQLFTMNPGTGLIWYASSNSSVSWDLSGGVTLWDNGARWKSSVQSTRAENSYFTGGNVGVGTATISARLHVLGSTTTTTPTLLVRESQAMANATAAFDVQNSAGTSILFVSGSGNVGVGSNSPTQKLDVNGAVKATNNLVAQGTLLAYTGAGAFLSWESTYGRLEAYSYTSSTYQDMAISPNGGNVGIRTSGPSNTLDVNGTLRVRTVSNATGNFATYSGTGVLQQRTAAEVKTDLSLNNVQNLSVSQIFNNTGAVHGTRSDFANITDFGYQYVQGSTNGPNLNSATQYYAWTIGLGSEYPYTNYGAQFAIPRAVANPYMGVRYREATTWSSWHKLAAGNADILTTARTLWGQSFDGSGNVTGNLTSVGNITGNSGITLTAAGTLSLVASGANVITATTNGTEALRIDSSQNVGIGTATAGTRLHVYSGATDEVSRFESTGNPYISLYDTGVRQGYLYSNTSSVELVAENSKPLYLQGATEIRLRTNTTTDRVIINSGGVVGINYTPPVTTAVTKLMVSGDIGMPKANAALLGNLYYDTAVPGWKYGANGYGWGFREDNAGLLQMVRAGNNTSGANAAASISLTDLFTFDLVNNRVGLGTGSPSTKFHVLHSSNDPVMIEQTTDAAWNRIYFKKPTRSWTLGPDNSTGTNNLFVLADETAGAYRVTVDTSGNVGINTSSMSRKLVVHGSDALINDITIGRGGLSPSATSVTNTVLGNSTFGQATSSQTGNVAIGYLALNNATTGADGNVAMGALALNANTTAKGNVGIGYYAMSTITTASGSVAVGYEALKLATGADNTAVGWWAGKSISTATGNVAVGSNALATATTSGGSTAVGAFALYNNTSPYNTAVGYGAGVTVSTGLYNTSLGAFAGGSISSQSNSTAVGYSALVNATGAGNSAFGYNAGSAITSSTKNLILGGYTGNAGGLDIRTSTASINSNNIILSDGDGNIRARFDFRGAVGVGTTTAVDGYAMHVVTGSTNANTRMLVQSTGTEKAAGYWTWSRTADFGYFEGDSNGNFKIGSFTSNRLDLVTNNTVALTVDTSQNVGIGTVSTGGEALRVYRSSGCTLGIYSNTSNATLGVSGYQTTTPVTAALEVSSTAASVGTATSHPLRIVTVSGERMRIDTTGKVGIGTTNPTATLSVMCGATQARINAVYTDYAGIFLNGSTTDNDYNFLSNASGSDKNLYINRPDGWDIRFRKNNGDQVTITSAGRVGIGTATPDLGFLHVNGVITNAVLAFSFGWLRNQATASGRDTFTFGTTVNCSIYGSDRIITGTEFNALSDYRTKNVQRNIESEEGLRFIEQVNPVIYTWKSDERKELKYGFIAQDVLKAGFGPLVGIQADEKIEEYTDEEGFTSPKGGRFIMCYDNIVPLLSAAMRGLKQENDSLKSEIQSLKDQISSILEMLNNK